MQHHLRRTIEDFQHRRHSEFYRIVPNEELRNRLFSWMAANELDEPYIFAPIATMAAFNEGEEWRRQMLHYIEGNIMFVEDYLKENIPQIKPLVPAGVVPCVARLPRLRLQHDALRPTCSWTKQDSLNDGEMPERAARDSCA